MGYCFSLFFFFFFSCSVSGRFSLLFRDISFGYVRVALLSRVLVVQERKPLNRLILSFSFLKVAI